MPPAIVTELEGRARYERFAGRLYAPFTRSLWIDFILLAITSAIAVYVANDSSEIAPALAVAVVGTALACVGSWWWLFDRKRRAALEVLADHQVREGDDWKRVTGTSLPATVRSAERWLRERPDDPNGDALHVEIFERQLQVYEGSAPATADLHDRWRGLTPSPDRDLRRWCLAVLDAMAVIDADRDPWEVLAAARGDVGSVDPRARATRYVRIIVTTHVLFVLTLWFGAAFTAG